MTDIDPNAAPPDAPSSVNDAFRQSMLDTRVSVPDAPAAEPAPYAHPDETVALHETTVAAMARFCDSERVRFVRMLRDIFGG